VSWRDVLDGVDAVESWIAGQSYWVQVPLLLAVLLPVGWLLAVVIDRIVDRILWPHTRREMRFAAEAAIARGGRGTPATPIDDAAVPAPAAEQAS
jgi:hypothetical protein